MMKFMVANRKRAAELTKLESLPKTAIVSITDIGSMSNSFANNPNILGIHRVQFNDVEKGETGAMTVDHAVDILDFVKQHLDAELILVHCEGGVSRSAGVAAALMKIFNGDDMEIFKSPRFCPNMTCYRNVLMAHFNEVQEEEIADKENTSLKVWRESWGIEEEL